MGNLPAHCSNCGAPLSPGARFCEECGTSVAPQAVQLQSPAWEVPAPTGFGRGLPVASFSGSDPLLEYDVAYPERLSRWRIFVKWLLAIPHYFVLYFVGLAASVVAVIAFFAILITGRYPRGMWDFSMLYLRWYANLNAYAVMLQRDEYPPFGDGPYPVRVHLDYPETLSRWKIFVKWLLAIPHYLVLSVLGIALAFVVFVAFFAILITGKYHRGMFDFVAGVTRWTMRVNAYVLLLTDRYPPFSMD